jgi:hypothetical protein
MTGIGGITIEMVTVALFDPPAFLAVTVTPVVPVAVGVPLIIPVLALSTSPGGKLAEVE